MLSTPLPAISARKARRYAIASMRDREALESTALGALTTFVESDGKSLRLANTFPLVAVAASDEGAKDLNSALQQLYRMRTIPEVPVVRIDEAAPENIPLLVSQLLESSLDRLVSHVSKVHTELAMLRRERETMFENYRAIEDAFHARNWDSSTEIFSHAPLVDPKDEGFAKLLRESEIEQLFPVSSYAVSGFALHFRDLPANRNGQLIVTLDYLENGEGIAEWLVPYAMLHSEWNFFSLPKACDGSHRTLRLRISATGGVPPELSLGNVIANERYAARARIPHGDLDMRPLALRILRGFRAFGQHHCPTQSCRPRSSMAARSMIIACPLSCCAMWPMYPLPRLHRIFRLCGFWSMKMPSVAIRSRRALPQRRSAGS